MTDNMKKFLELISSNEELTAKVSGTSHEETIAIAKEVGIELTDADFEAQSCEIGDDELDAVSGGDKCYCAMGGGGTASAGQQTCACVMGGAGFTKTGGINRCWCAVGGSGSNAAMDEN